MTFRPASPWGGPLLILVQSVLVRPIASSIKLLPTEATAWAEPDTPPPGRSVGSPRPIFGREPNVNDTDELLDNEQTAALLGIKPNTLEIWRHKGRGPAHCKLGDTPQAPVRYLRSKVNEWVRQRTFTSTSASTAARLPTRQPICSSY